MRNNGKLLTGAEETRSLVTTTPESNGSSTLGQGTFTSNQYYGQENEILLREYWRAIYKHLWLVIGITIVVTLFATVYVARQPDIYEAQAQVQVDLENSNSVGGSTKNSSIIVNNQTNDPAYFNTQLQILSGPGLLRRVVKTLDLPRDSSFTPQGRNQSISQSILRMVGARKPAPQPTASPAEIVTAPNLSDDLAEAKTLVPYVRAIQSNLKVEPVKEVRVSGVKETRLIEVRYTHSDPQVASKIVNAIVTVFVRSNLEMKNEANATTGEFLLKRVADLQSQIREGEERLVNYAKSKEILSLDQSQNTVVERLAGLNRELLEAEKERTDAEAAFRSSQRPGAAEAKAEDSAKTISEYEAKIAELRAKRDQLLVDNTEEWFEVKEVNQQIAVLEKQLQDTRTQTTKVVKINLETKFQEAKAKEDTLRAAYEKQRAETMTQNEAAINYRIIQQEIETNKELLAGLLQRSKENDVVLAGTPNNIHVVEYAIAPDEPIGPARLRVIVLAFLLSLGLGIALAIFLEYLNDTVRSSEDVEKMLRLPTLAVIPAIGNGKKASGRRLLTGLAPNGRSHSELLVAAEPRSALGEAYRHLRTSVLLSTAGRPPKTILVTSSVPSEGKTTTTINTAMTLAQTGGKVLIIDADMRRPRLCSIFGVEQTVGLSSILSREMSEQDILSTAIPTEAEHVPKGLFLLTSGPVPPNPAELVGSDQMRRLLSVFAPAFDYIVIDSPPIASFTDGVLLASMVDGVLLVVHGGRSSREVVRRSQQRLLDIGAKIFGVVLNNVRVQSHDYHYYQSYYHDGYYSQQSEEEVAGTKG